LKVEDFTSLGDAIASSFNSENKMTPADIRSLYDAAIANIRAANSAMKVAVDGSEDGTETGLRIKWFESRKNDIERDFSNRLNEAKATLIANGTYNETIWLNVVSGFTRDKQYALTDLGDSFIPLKVDAYARLASVTADAESRLMEALARAIDAENALVDFEAKIADVRSRLMETAARVIESIQKNRTSLTDLRNNVLKWMYDFMERREDEYPGIEQLASVSERLGYANGGATPTASTST
jgi:hypothetical protein